MPQLLRWAVDAGQLLQRALRAWIDDHAPSMGAALAYYTLFSLAPLLLIVISLAGLVFGPEAARGEIIGQLRGLLGEDSARAIEALLQSVNQPRRGAAATLVGVGVLLVGATSVFAELQDAMDRIWRAPTRPAGGAWALLRARLLSLGMILGIGFLLIVSLVASATLAALSRWWTPWLGPMVALAQLLDVALSFAFVTAVFALIYKWMPRVKVAWGDVVLGAFVTASLFTVGKTLIATYIGTSGVASPFGAAASLVVLLVWVYWSAQIFLLGAEITWVYANVHGSLRRPPARPGGLLRDRRPGRAPTSTAQDQDVVRFATSATASPWLAPARSAARRGSVPSSMSSAMHVAAVQSELEPGAVRRRRPCARRRR